MGTVVALVLIVGLVIVAATLFAPSDGNSNEAEPTTAPQPLPQASILAPAENAIVSLGQPVAIQFMVSGSDGITRVDLRRFGQTLDSIPLASSPATYEGSFVYWPDSTGLHTVEVRKLLRVLDRLVDAGNTVLVVEHHPEVIAHADWIIDLGPEGGEAGGEVVVQGNPGKVAACRASHTGKLLIEGGV